ncbi:hypothetical protein KHP60_09645 [Microvirga sp. 3-52]|uniref:hypothetical protein n=1 Tax=Microvirga sp. 3-52 TaxID=2792425 RepID=UPI001AC3DB2D|nr:hypothetical protein [Microvirga sp. 3-52]MBO1905312.1 hypothetical protein [Microvirga sp. 3-52]MBS7452599.1 hypothetical protein [Microvirga sp. 3-52]
MSADDNWSERRLKKEKALLESLRFSLEIGCCAILKNKISRYGAGLASSANSDTRAEYARIIEDAEGAFQIEAIHGQGSLIKLDHPIVIDLIGKRVPRVPAAISSEEIAAAKRYRSITASAGGD